LSELKAQQIALRARIDARVAEMAASGSSGGRVIAELTPLTSQLVALEQRIRRHTPRRDLRHELAHLDAQLRDGTFAPAEQQRLERRRDALRVYLAPKRPLVPRRPLWHFVLAGVLMFGAIVFVTVVLPPLVFGRV
jgi:hypothetical protein